MDSLERDDDHTDSAAQMVPGYGFLVTHQLVLMIAGSIVIALLFVVMAMNLYNSSGAAQVDLSRPGYQSVRKQSIQRDDNYSTYPSTGTITADTIKDFKSKYDKRAQKAQATKAFTAEVFTDDALLMSDGSAAPDETD